LRIFINSFKDFFIKLRSNEVMNKLPPVST
jgi:hypothetical protein